MSILIIAPGRIMNEWRSAMIDLDPSLEIEIYPQVKDNNKISAALVWKYPHGVLREFPGLQWVSSLGAGVDHILHDPQLPSNLRITRIIDENMNADITKMVITALTIFEKDLFRYYEDQLQEKWEPSLTKRQLVIGMLGMGHIGKTIADSLSLLKYEITGFSKSGGNYKNLAIYSADQLDEFLSKINTLICTLPLTEETENFIDDTFLSKMNRESYLINVSRGKIIDDNALLKYLNNGILSKAYLDVFQEEPLPPGHDFWHHPKIFITPHISGVTNIENGAKQIVENYLLFQNENKLNNEIDKIKGY